MTNYGVSEWYNTLYCYCISQNTCQSLGKCSSREWFPGNMSDLQTIEGPWPTCCSGLMYGKVPHLRKLVVVVRRSTSPETSDTLAWEKKRMNKIMTMLILGLGLLLRLGPGKWLWLGPGQWLKANVCVRQWLGIRVRTMTSVRARTMARVRARAMARI